MTPPTENGAALFGWHSQDSRATGPLDTADTVTAHYGTGGGNTPLIVQPCICIQGSMIGRAEKNGPQGDGLNQEVCFTLNTVDEHAVAYTFAEQNYSEYVLSPAGGTIKANGGRYPRFVIWENVYGALSSNGGDDFEIVLNELLHLTGSNEFIRQHGIWGGFAGYGEVAYRVVDAKYWGVPQRRKRVYAVADTGGESANEILFDRKGDEWNFRPRLPAGKAVAGLADDCYCWHERMVQAKSSGGGNLAYTLKIRQGCDGGGKGALIQTELSATLATNNDQTLFAPVTKE